LDCVRDDLVNIFVTKYIIRKKEEKYQKCIEEAKTHPVTLNCGNNKINAEKLSLNVSLVT
jgi:hypothetical protein